MENKKTDSPTHAVSNGQEFSAEELSYIQECDELLAAFNDKYKSLKKAQAQGQTREEWLEEQMDSYPENVVDDISKNLQETVDNQFNE